MQNPSVVADADGEWFEIYNKGNVEVPLQNWTIKDADNEYTQLLVARFQLVHIYICQEQ
jgi:hypothetical protein